MKNKILKMALVCGLALFAGGCSDAIEPDTLGYVVALGIDVPEQGEKGYNITLQFANPSKISGGSSEEGGKGGGDSIENITVTAPEIYSAVNIANHIISKKFVLSHTKVIVFSEEIARGGIKGLLETIGRSTDIRPNTYFAVSKGKAREFLESVNPETEINPVRYYTMIFENDYSGFIPQNMSADFYFFCESDEKCCVMPICAVSGAAEEHNYSETGYQYGLEDYRAGQIPSGSEQTQVMGMGVFYGDKLVGEFGDIETEMYNILTGQYTNSYVVYRYSKSPDNPVTVIQKQKHAPKISVDMSGNVPKIRVEVFVEGEFASSTPQKSVEDDLKDFSKEAAGELKAQLLDFLKQTQDLNTDIVGFGSYAKRNFKDINEFSAYKWLEKYKDAKFEINVDFAVLRTGLVVRSDRE